MSSASTNATTGTSSKKKDEEIKAKNEGGGGTEKLIKVIKSVSDERRNKTCLVCWDKFSSPSLWKRRIDSPFKMHHVFVCMGCGEGICQECDERMPKFALVACPKCRLPRISHHDNRDASNLKLFLSLSKTTSLPCVKHKLGELYVSVDIDRSIYWFEKAYQQGWYESGVMLGNIYYCLYGDLDKSLQYLKVVVEATNEADANMALVTCLWDICDQTVVMQALQHAARQDHPIAQYYLCLRYFKGTASVTKCVDDTALTLCLMSAINGYVWAQLEFCRIIHDMCPKEFKNVAPMMMYFAIDASSSSSSSRRNNGPEDDDLVAINAMKQIKKEIKDGFQSFCSKCNMSLQGKKKKLHCCDFCEVCCYCSKSCQEVHWRNCHKKFCIPKDVKGRKTSEEKLEFFLFLINQLTQSKKIGRESKH